MNKPSKIKRNFAKYAIQIDTPSNGDHVNSIDVDVSGSYKIAPPEGTLRLFTLDPDGHYWPQQIANLDDKNRTWHGQVHLGEASSDLMFLVIALVGETGQTLWDYYYKVGELSNWQSFEGDFPPDIIECNSVFVRRKASKISHSQFEPMVE